MFYGWGRKSREWPLSDGNTLAVTYQFVSLMFVFKVAFKQKWYVIGDSRSQDQQVPRSELEARYGDNLPKLNAWEQWGLFIALGVLIVIVLFASLF